MRKTLLATLVAVFCQTPAQANPTHMQFIDTDETLIHHVGTGTSDAPGDIMTFVGVLTEVNGTKQVGSEQGFCIRIDIEKKNWECAFTVLLQGGQISLAGPFFDEGESIVAVTGGVGKYVGAKGTLHVRLRGTTPETDLFTFDLL